MATNNQPNNNDNNQNNNNTFTGTSQNAYESITEQTVHLGNYLSNEDILILNNRNLIFPGLHSFCDDLLENEEYYSKAEFGETILKDYDNRTITFNLNIKQSILTLFITKLSQEQLKSWVVTNFFILLRVPKIQSVFWNSYSGLSIVFRLFNLLNSLTVYANDYYSRSLADLYTDYTELFNACVEDLTPKNSSNYNKVSTFDLELNKLILTKIGQNENDGLFHPYLVRKRWSSVTVGSGWKRYVPTKDNFEGKTYVTPDDNLGDLSYYTNAQSANANILVLAFPTCQRTFGESRSSFQSWLAYKSRNRLGHPYDPKLKHLGLVDSAGKIEGTNIAEVGELTKVDWENINKNFYSSLNHKHFYMFKDWYEEQNSYINTWFCHVILTSRTITRNTGSVSTDISMVYKIYQIGEVYDFLFGVENYVSDKEFNFFNYSLSNISDNQLLGKLISAMENNPMKIIRNYIDHVKTLPFPTDQDNTNCNDYFKNLILYLGTKDTNPAIDPTNYILNSFIQIILIMMTCDLFLLIETLINYKDSTLIEFEGKFDNLMNITMKLINENKLTSNIYTISERSNNFYYVPQKDKELIETNDFWRKMKDQLDRLDYQKTTNALTYLLGPLNIDNDDIDEEKHIIRNDMIFYNLNYILKLLIKLSLKFHQYVGAQVDLHVKDFILFLILQMIEKDGGELKDLLDPEFDITDLEVNNILIFANNDVKDNDYLLELLKQYFTKFYNLSMDDDDIQMFNNFEFNEFTKSKTNDNSNIRLDIYVNNNDWIALYMDDTGKLFTNSKLSYKVLTTVMGIKPDQLFIDNKLNKELSGTSARTNRFASSYINMRRKMIRSIKAQYGQDIPQDELAKRFDELAIARGLKMRYADKKEVQGLSDESNYLKEIIEIFLKNESNLDKMSKIKFDSIYYNIIDNKIDKNIKDIYSNLTDKEQKEILDVLHNKYLDNDINKKTNNNNNIDENRTYNQRNNSILQDYLLSLRINDPDLRYKNNGSSSNNNNNSNNYNNDRNQNYSSRVPHFSQPNVNNNNNHEDGSETRTPGKSINDYFPWEYLDDDFSPFVMQLQEWNTANFVYDEIIIPITEETIYYIIQKGAYLDDNRMKQLAKFTKEDDTMSLEEFNKTFVLDENKKIVVALTDQLNKQYLGFYPYYITDADFCHSQSELKSYELLKADFDYIINNYTQIHNKVENFYRSPDNIYSTNKTLMLKEYYTSFEPKCVEVRYEDSIIFVYSNSKLDEWINNKEKSNNQRQKLFNDSFFDFHKTNNKSQKGKDKNNNSINDTHEKDNFFDFKAKKESITDKNNSENKNVRFKTVTGESSKTNKSYTDSNYNKPKSIDNKEMLFSLQQLHALCTLHGVKPYNNYLNDYFTLIDNKLLAKGKIENLPDEYIKISKLDSSIRLTLEELTDNFDCYCLKSGDFFLLDNKSGVKLDNLVPESNGKIMNLNGKNINYYIKDNNYNVFMYFNAENKAYYYYKIKSNNDPSSSYTSNNKTDEAKAEENNGQVNNKTSNNNLNNSSVKNKVKNKDSKVELNDLFTFKNISQHKNVKNNNIITESNSGEKDNTVKVDVREFVNNLNSMNSKDPNPISPTDVKEQLFTKQSSFSSLINPVPEEPEEEMIDIDGMTVKLSHINKELKESDADLVKIQEFGYPKEIYSPHLTDVSKKLLMKTFTSDMVTQVLLLESRRLAVDESFKNNVINEILELHPKENSMKLNNRILMGILNNLVKNYKEYLLRTNNYGVFLDDQLLFDKLSRNDNSGHINDSPSKVPNSQTQVNLEETSSLDSMKLIKKHIVPLLTDKKLLSKVKYLISTVDIDIKEEEIKYFVNALDKNETVGLCNILLDHHTTNPSEGFLKSDTVELFETYKEEQFMKSTLTNNFQKRLNEIRQEK